ncbi:hypothetical protein GCM10022140_23110 [Rhodococcus aetherivorans]
MPEGIQDDLFELEYRQRFSLSVEQSEREPWEAKWLARHVWSLQAQRANLIAEGQGAQDVF